ncbi:porin [Neisseria perflava]|uniref:porin n=1 Tax=Neisseria perflava TaxID=33053 RepID=UPI00209E756C|nr:porin [Neisseria perflava]MCP1661202.1 major outer membrane protein P.IB [Neisseria perflava]
MQKAVMAWILAALPLTVAAEVTLYGQIKSSVSVNQVKIKGDSGTEKSSTSTRINDNTSRLGFKGSERLSGDVKAIWQVEQRISVLGDKSGWATRDSFIGLEGKFGKIRAGHLNNLLNEMDTIDTWMGNPSATYLSIFTRTGTRTTSVRYDSPAFKGWKLNLQYAPRDNQNATDKYAYEVAGRDQYNVGLIYDNGKDFFVKTAYNLRKNRVGYQDGHIVRVETAYLPDKFFLGAGVQYAKANESGNTYLSHFLDGFGSYNGNSLTVDSGKTKAVKVVDAAVTAGYNFGHLRPRISYAHGWPAKGVGSDKTLVDKFDQIVVGGDYRFSKRTALRGQLAYMRVGGDTQLYTDGSGQLHKGKVEQTAATLGLHHRF